MQNLSKKKSFKQSRTVQHRRKITQQAIKKNPQVIVVVIEKHHKYNNIVPDLLHSRFLVDCSQKVVQVLQAVKSRLALIDAQCKVDTINLMINNKILGLEHKIVDLYKDYKDKEDGILYITYSNLESF